MYRNLMYAVLFAGHFIQIFVFVCEEEQVRKQRGTISAHWDANGLLKNSTSKLYEDIVNQVADVVAESVLGPRLVSTFGVWRL